MKKKLLLLICLLVSLSFWFFQKGYALDYNSFNVVKEVEKWSFIEYWSKIIREYYKISDSYELDQRLDTAWADRMMKHINAAYNYLPDSLGNENNRRSLIQSLKKAIKHPDDYTYFSLIKSKLDLFLWEADIQAIDGTIQAGPLEGNAPLTVTLRAKLVDPTGTKIPKNSYTWWMNIWWTRKKVGEGTSIVKTFTQEWSYTIFLDAKTSHKNKRGYGDVIPYSKSITIEVKEKIASVIVRVGWKKIPVDAEIKFSPEEWRYGLIFDASSSVPATATKFLETSWDFGNGIKKVYKGSPKIHRIIYVNEWEYDAVLKLKVNEWNVVTKAFRISIRKPIASIKFSNDEWYMWDKFIFTAVVHGPKKSLLFDWEIIDLDSDRVIFNKNGSIFNYTFKTKWRYSVKLKVKDSAGNIDIDNQDIYINSRAPIARFSISTPSRNKPNEVFLDATATIDPDYGDDGKLKYSWLIDWDRVNLEKANDNGSLWYYTFSSEGEHSIILEVEDPDEISALDKQTVSISSTLSVDFAISPNVTQRKKRVKFIAHSLEAQFFEWDFWDGVEIQWNKNTVEHSYRRSGTFTVTLVVKWKNNKRNSFSKDVYVWDTETPVALIEIEWEKGAFVKREQACEWEDAYIISRSDRLSLSSNQSIDIDGEGSGLRISWKIGRDHYAITPVVKTQFDEVGCFPIKLTVTSIKWKTSDSKTIYVKVENEIPTLTAIGIQPVDINSDPVVINLSALWAKDRDGVIQSYLWYYTTDTDNEPQDFRVSKLPQTTFVLPKIPWNYYFWVVLKDNNEAKISSEDIIGRNSITLEWDNVNTPLVVLSVNDSSVLIGDSVDFSAKAESILWRNIEHNSTFSWDFDGDGFYERETNTWDVSYKYKRSGTFFPKVKVKHKGFSNTRTLKIDVANRLHPDFAYISIGNKYVLLDKSTGTIDNYKWDLWDGNTQQNKKSFTYKYNDNKSVHEVELSVAEGTTVKNSTKKVKRNGKNLLKAHKKGLNVFSYPAVNASGTIILDEEEPVYIYLGESKGDYSYYGIDYDIDTDTDLNGWKDDDVDNINSASYKKGDPEVIRLTNLREQTVRVFLLDKNKKTIDSKDIIIEKTYIEKLDDGRPWVLEWASDEEKAKIEEIKDVVGKFNRKSRIKGMQLIAKLQEEWDDKTEKTKNIINIEKFLNRTWENEKDIEDLTNTLESFIVDSDGGISSEVKVSFQALKNLLPGDLECLWSWTGWCVWVLEEIRDSNDIEKNRGKAKLILSAVQGNASMNAKEKQDVRAIMQILVYWWLDNVPNETIDWINSEPIIEVASTENPWLMALIKKIGWWIVGIIGLLLLVMFVFWIIDFLKNKKTGESFEEFVNDKTADEKEEDILWDFSWTIEEEPLVTEIEPIKKIEEEEVVVVEWSESKEEIPDWLSWNAQQEEKKEIEVEEPKIEVVEGVKKIEEPEVLEVTEEVEEKITIEEEKLQEEENVWISLSAPEEEESEEDPFDFDDETKIAEESPEWLQEDLIEQLPEKEELPVDNEEIIIEEEVVEKGELVKIEKKGEKKKEIEENLSDWVDDEIPDWLQESVENTEDETGAKEEDLSKEDDGIPDWLQWSLDDSKEEKEEPNEEISKKRGKEKVETVELDDEDVPDWLKWSTETTQEAEEIEDAEVWEELKKKSDKKSDELWDDGMSVPDWLKTENEK